MYYLILQFLKRIIKEYFPQSTLRTIGTLGKIVAAIGGLGLAIALYLYSGLDANDPWGGIAVVVIGGLSMLLIVLGWEMYTLE